ncbi:PQQ-binding-like beta-propeller repeat protein [Maribellus sp. YY47]|uniref:outer membrane protein assembly factor BamB family protein n=1 Tax=Maribellus sp. YY47 TaxID=2929486 RepID=UPI00200090D4|nr:PQQ-binding-like beta-propeller repeat protein [Maribellus sp. YY47]MCK3682974.1 PQQ-binding-like beta-propeller repeat protein [Maribellus sp. YY47]
MTKKAFSLLLPTFLLTINLLAQNPTMWRGDGSGVYHETGLLKEWPANGPEILWSFEELGDGHASPVVANNTIYVSGMADSIGFVFALSQDGKLKWKATYGKEFAESYPGARSSVVVAGDLLYMYSGLGELVCMSSANGEKKWSKNVLKEFDGGNITWGVTETVVIDGDLVYVTPGGKQHNVVALNRFSGNLVWSSPGKGELSAYCTPLLVELPTRKLLVTHTADHVIGIDAKSGDLLWNYPHTNRWKVHPNTPVYSNGGLFCFSGYGQGGVKLDLSADGSSVSKAWTKTELDSRMGGMVVLDGYLYGSGDNAREWRCVNWETGEETYAAKDIAKGVVIAGEGMLYCYSERGELALVKADPKEFKVISQTKVELGSAQHWAHPVINDGRLLVRHGNALIAYKIR